MKISEGELYQVSDMHFNLLGDGFLASLGRDFLYLLYKEIYVSDSATLIVVREGNLVLGFISGGIGLKHIYVRLVKSPVKLIHTIVPRLVNRRMLAQLISVLLRNKRVRYNGKPQTSAELYSICVPREYQGTGLADELYLKLSQYFADNNIDEFLIFVGEKLARAQSFYIRKGAVRVGSLEQGAGKMSVIFSQKTERCSDTMSALKSPL